MNILIECLLQLTGFKYIVTSALPDIHTCMCALRPDICGIMQKKVREMSRFFYFARQQINNLSCRACTYTIVLGVVYYAMLYDVCHHML